VYEVDIITIVLEQDTAVEAGDAAELAIDAEVPALRLEFEIGQVAVVIRLGPGITAGQADAGIAAEPIVSAELEAISIGLQFVVDVERDAGEDDTVIVAKLLLAPVPVAPAHEP